MIAAPPYPTRCHLPTSWLAVRAPPLTAACSSFRRCKSRSREGVLRPPPRVAAIARQALCAEAAISRCGLTLEDARLVQLEAPILVWNSFLLATGLPKTGCQI